MSNKKQNKIHSLNETIKFKRQTIVDLFVVYCILFVLNLIYTILYVLNAIFYIIDLNKIENVIFDEIFILNAINLLIIGLYFYTVYKWDQFCIHLFIILNLIWILITILITSMSFVFSGQYSYTNNLIEYKIFCNF